MNPLVNFNDTKIAFSLKSNQQLKQSYFLFTVIGRSFLTAIAKPVTNFMLFIRFPITSLLKKTVFQQFCGGETIEDCSNIIEKMYGEKNVCSILDYSIEGKKNEEQFDKTLHTILDTLNFAKKEKATPFIVFKGTGLGRFEIFEKISSNKTLTSSEREEWLRVWGRIDGICSACARTKNLRVMVDAEESWIQKALDNITEEMMATYNTQRVVVYNTVQLYRWDRLTYLEHLYQKTAAANYKIGVKLVRGAYMEKERKRALALNYKSPICNTKQATDENFDKGMLYCVKRLDGFEIFLGTHNEVSSLKLTTAMKENGLKASNNGVWFGQLYGMSDHISFNLAAQNYNTAKYLPFGPVKEVIPYLLRRAEENTSVGTQTSRELVLIKKEITRRKRQN